VITTGGRRSAGRLFASTWSLAGAKAKGRILPRVVVEETDFNDLALDFKCFLINVIKLFFQIAQ
jgi:hypothetical protein